MSDPTFTDSDRLREVAAIRFIWVDRFVQRKVDIREGVCTSAEIDAWESEGYRLWRAHYPALNSLFPSHFPAEAFR